MISKERPKPVVLLVSLDGGVGEKILARDGTLEIRVIDDLARVRSALSKAAADAVVIALEQPTARYAADIGALVRAMVGPILVLSQPATERPVTDMIKTGIGGYMFTTDAARLADSIRELLRGGVPMSYSVSRLVLGRARRSSGNMRAVKLGEPAGPDFITSRQREILKLLAGGHSYEDIARALSLSVNTVRTHVRTIYDRLGASTKVEAVIAAMELRLLDPEPFR